MSSTLFLIKYLRISYIHVNNIWWQKLCLPKIYFFYHKYENLILFCLAVLLCTCWKYKKNKCSLEKLDFFLAFTKFTANFVWFPLNAIRWIYFLVKKCMSQNTISDFLIIIAHIFFYTYWILNWYFFLCHKGLHTKRIYQNN